MKSAEDVANRGHVDPLLACDTEEVLRGTLFLLARDDEVAKDHGQHRDCAEDQVGNHKALRLLRKEFLVEVETV